VALCVTIGKEGSASNVSVISGPKELVSSAVEAVQQGRFRLSSRMVSQSRRRPEYW
jgi:hypothetical protein